MKINLVDHFIDQILSTTILNNSSARNVVSLKSSFKVL